VMWFFYFTSVSNRRLVRGIIYTMK
jgi:hypothetical protein